MHNKTTVKGNEFTEKVIPTNNILYISNEIFRNRKK